MRKRLTISAWTIALCVGTGCALAAPSPSTLGGPDGGYDYAAFDGSSSRLYVARPSSVTAYDLKDTSAPRSLGTIAHGHAVLPVSDGKALLVTSGEDDSVRFLDSGDGHEIAKVPVGKKPDGAAIDRARNRAYVMDGEGGTVSVIDLATRTLISTVTLKPGLEFPAIGGDTLFVNNEDANEIETVDLQTLKAGPAIALAGCTGPTGLAYDAQNERLISACDNGKAVIVSARRRRLETLLPIGKGPDAVLIDTAERRALIPCGASGELYAISLAGTGLPRVTGHVATETGARTGALDPATGLAYLPTARFGPAPAGAHHGAMVPGSFHVLIVDTRKMLP